MRRERRERGAGRGEGWLMTGRSIALLVGSPRETRDDIRHASPPDAAIMASIETRTVEPDEAGMRLDRWFKAHFPDLSFGHLQKLIRSGQVRVDGGRAKTNTRLEAGQAVRVPPLGEGQGGVSRLPGTARAEPREASAGEGEAIDPPTGAAVARPTSPVQGEERRPRRTDAPPTPTSSAPSSSTRTTTSSSSTSRPASPCRAAPA